MYVSLSISFPEVSKVDSLVVTSARRLFNAVGLLLSDVSQNQSPSHWSAYSQAERIHFTNG